MNGGHSYSDDALYLDNHTTVTGPLHFQENTLLALKVTTRDTDFSSFRQVQFIRLEIQEMVVIGTGNGNETLHLAIGDDYLPSATGIGNVLQVTDLGLHTLHIRRTGMDKKQIVDNRNQSSDFLSLQTLFQYLFPIPFYGFVQERVFLRGFETLSYT